MRGAHLPTSLTNDVTYPLAKFPPQARQVSDRWHLVKNLAACVSVQLA
jgi:hypothetical protein